GEEEKRRRLKRTLLLYAAAAGAISIALPLAGLLYVRTNSQPAIPAPKTPKEFSPAAPLSPAQKALMPAAPDSYLSQQQGEGSLGYVRGTLYARPKPRQPPSAAPPPAPKRPPARKIAAMKPKPVKTYAPFTPPTLDQGFGSRSGGPGSQSGLGSAMGQPPGSLSALSSLGSAMPDLGNLLKSLPSLGKSIGGLGNLGGLGKLLGGTHASQNGAQAEPQPQSAPAAPQLNTSNGP
ncbi:MAG: hypothetical protein KGI84_09935, partial [Elusimicrobia bacterium]|nr:hypothetical protein [Elusimicrobiota bacterium]